MNWLQRTLRLTGSTELHADPNIVNRTAWNAAIALGCIVAVGLVSLVLLVKG